jgi:hypothetical protein
MEIVDSGNNRILTCLAVNIQLTQINMQNKHGGLIRDDKETESRPQWKTDCAIRRDRLTILLWIKFVSLLSSLRSLFQVFTVLSLL